MKKLAYTAPVVEITKWEKQDIITTSGLETIASEIRYDKNISNAIGMEVNSMLIVALGDSYG